MPAKSDNAGGLKYLGGGGFGRVYSIKMYSRDSGTEIEAALKVVRYEIHHLSEINKELNVLQKLAPQYPLYLLRYYGCVNAETPYATLFIFTEKLDYDLDARMFKNNFRKSPLARQIGIFLNMAYAVKAFHDKEIGHFDIKPGNFGLIHHEEYPIVKLIDYGLTGRFCGGGRAGTSVFMDPEMGKDEYEFKAKSDIFSLGITYHLLLLGSQFVYINDKNYMKRQYLEVSMELAINRQNEFTQKCNNAMQDAYKIAQKALEERNGPFLKHQSYNSFISIIPIINKMTNIEHDDRPTIDEVIEIFERELNKINTFTLYLKTNSKDLEKTIYGNSLEWNNSPPIIDVEINNAPIYPEDERTKLIFAEP